MARVLWTEISIRHRLSITLGPMNSQSWLSQHQPEDDIAKSAAALLEDVYRTIIPCYTSDYGALPIYSHSRSHIKRPHHPHPYTPMTSI